MLGIKEKITLEGIISFLEAKIKDRFMYDKSVVKFLREELDEVKTILETLSATSAEEDHMKATYSKVLSMHQR